MSAAACLLKQQGFEVVGSDSGEIYSPSKDVLDKNRIKYFVGYKVENILSNPSDLYVVSAGEDAQNPELGYLQEQQIPYFGFAEVLAEFYKEKLRVVVTGTHGKSTTSAILGHILSSFDGSGFMVGGVLKNTGNNFAPCEGNYFVFEGDEYKNLYDDPVPKFHYYKPDILVLTNLEYDHPDMFQDFESMKDEFRELIDKMPDDGLLIYNADSPELVKLAHQSHVVSVSFSLEAESDFKLDEYEFGEYTKFKVWNKNSKNQVANILGLAEEYKTQILGKHNLYNSLAAIATLRTLGFSQEQIALELISFSGIKRRFELVGQKNGVLIIDDYAHHPTAVRETLLAARAKYPECRIWAIFEPHTFSRTKATLAELASSFDSADMVLISEIYPAREKATDATIQSDDVIKAAKTHNSEFKIQNSLRKVANKEEALNILKAELRPNDVVIVMAVGAFNRLAYELIETI